METGWAMEPIPALRVGQKSKTKVGVIPERRHKKNTFSPFFAKKKSEPTSRPCFGPPTILSTFVSRQREMPYFLGFIKKRENLGITKLLSTFNQMAGRVFRKQIVWACPPTDLSFRFSGAWRAKPANGRYDIRGAPLNSRKVLR